MSQPDNYASVKAAWADGKSLSRSCEGTPCCPEYISQMVSKRKHPGTELDGEIAVRTKRIPLEYDQYGAYIQDKQRKL